MKDKKLLRMMSSADDKYVEEADPAKNHQRRGAYKKIIIAAVVAASLLFGTLATAGFAVGTWLFKPFDNTPPDVSMYSDSEYYELIQKINVLTYENYEKPEYGNNFGMICGSLFNMFLKGAAMGKDESLEMNGDIIDGAADTASGTGESYEEITDNQTAGVIEGDRIKRSSEHIYFLDGNVLRIYSIAGEDSVQLGSYDLADNGESYYSYHAYREIYLSADCKTVTVISPIYDKTVGSLIEIIALDVSNPSNVTEKKTVRLVGGYTSSRLTDGSFIVISEFSVRSSPDFSDESQFVPQIDLGSGYESIPMDGIISPNTLTSTRYTVICRFDENTLELDDASAFLSCGDHVYLSESTAYITRGFNFRSENGDKLVDVAKTEIYGMIYNEDSFRYIGSVLVDGHVENRYCLDEYEGILRVVTTTEANEYVKHDNVVFGTSETVMVSDVNRGTNASLYCIDFKERRIIASVCDFAPAGESVQSARFDGTAAYVCTSIELKDPVFFFDLSDLSNITFKDTGTIEGFSSSLVNFGDGYLLGIGVGASSDTLKIEVYEEDGDGVRSVCKYESVSTYNSSDYKSYYINRGEQLVGMGVTVYNRGDGQSRYILLHFDGYELRELVNVKLDGVNDYKRGVYIDGYMYMFGENDMKVQRIR